MNRNQLIHEWLMGLCWHDIQRGDNDLWLPCSKCGLRWADARNNPAYDSADSPRRLLDEAEAKCIEQVGRHIYGFHLAKQLDMASDLLPHEDEIGAFTLQHVSDIATATVAQRCSAIIRAAGLENENE